MTTLYILGNGFDLHHNIKSAYKNFKEYLENCNITLFNKIESFNDKNIFSKKLGENWSDIENALYLNLNKQSFLEKINITNDIITAFQQYFNEWIKDLDAKIKNGYFKKTTNFLNINKKDFFITFNYTNTLNYLYGIDDFNKKDLSIRIMHIHNKVNASTDIYNKTDQVNYIIFGNKQNASKLNVIPCDYIDYNYSNRFSKDTKKCFSKYETYIKKLANKIKTIKVYGHSLNFEIVNNDITNDGYYFQKIKESIPNAHWIFYYYKKEGIEKINNAIEILNFNKRNYSIFSEKKLYRYYKKVI